MLWGRSQNGYSTTEATVKGIYRQRGVRPMKTLIVDDVQIGGRVLATILAKYGQADACMSVREAVAQFQKAWKAKEPYDLVCLDISMPDIDGLKGLKILRLMEDKVDISEAQRAVIVMVSCNSNAQLMTACHDAGSNDYIVKPYTKNSIINNLRDLGLLEEPQTRLCPGPTNASTQESSGSSST